MKKSVIFLVIVFLFLTVLTYLKPLLGIDLAITRTIQEVNLKAFVSFMWLVTQIGNQPLMVFIVITVSLILFLKGLRREAVTSSLAVALGALSGSLIKMLIDRPRPSGDLVKVSVWLSDKSFPSNHVLVFTIFFGFLLYLIFKKFHKNTLNFFLSLIFILLIASIGISRIYLGAHWASDVLGGYLLGLVWLMATIKFYNSPHGKR